MHSGHQKLDLWPPGHPPERKDKAALTYEMSPGALVVVPGGWWVARAAAAEGGAAAFTSSWEGKAGEVAKSLEYVDMAGLRTIARESGVALPASGPDMDLRAAIIRHFEECAERQFSRRAHGTLAEILPDGCRITDKPEFIVSCHPWLQEYTAQEDKELMEEIACAVCDDPEIMTQGTRVDARRDLAQQLWTEIGLAAGLSDYERVGQAQIVVRRAGEPATTCAPHGGVDAIDVEESEHDRCQHRTTICTALPLRFCTRTQARTRAMRRRSY